MEGREDPVPPGPLHALAAGLRELRTRAPGSPSYDELAVRAGWPAAALADAASGSYLPTLDVTLAFVAACGGDVADWRERWTRLHASLRAPDANPPTVRLPAVPPDGPGGEHGGSDAAPGVPEDSQGLPSSGATGPDEPAGASAGDPGGLAEHLQPDGPVAPGAVAPLRRTDPRRVGPFRLLGRLGEGAAGRVYLGTSRARRPVAVRVIPPDRFTERAYRSRLAAELSAARRVHSRHSPSVVDTDPWAAEPWVATSYVPGPTLSDAVAAEGPLPCRLVWALAAALAEALREHHAVGVRHCALGPGNVLLTTDGFKVLDFGLARGGDGPQAAAAAGSWGADLAYPAPEQLEGRAATSAADVFALGCLLAFAATGVPPFGDGSTGGVAQRIARTEPLPASLAVDDANLRGLVIACLDRDPFRRPTPDEVAAACADHGLRANRLPPVLASAVARDDAEVSGILAEAARQRTLARLKFGAAPALLAVVAAISAVVAGQRPADHAGAARPTAAAVASAPVIGSATSAPPTGAVPTTARTGTAAAGTGTPAPRTSGSAAPSTAAAGLPSGSASSGPSGSTGCQGGGCAGKDPFATGCAGDGVVLYSLGTTAGVLEEWYSPTCQASWARIRDTSGGTWFYVQTCYSHYVQVFTVRQGYATGYTAMVPGGGPSIRVGDVYGHGPC